MFRSLAALTKVKATTGFVNFPVVPNPGAVLSALYKQTLTELQKFPADVRFSVSRSALFIISPFLGNTRHHWHSRIPSRRDQSSYRINTEKIIKHRQRVVDASQGDYEVIEAQIGCGQAEELIEQAKDELELIPVLLGTTRTQHRDACTS